VSGQLYLPAAFPPKERAPGTHCIGGPRNSLTLIILRPVSQAWD